MRNGGTSCWLCEFFFHSYKSTSLLVFTRKCNNRNYGIWEAGEHPHLLPQEHQQRPPNCNGRYCSFWNGTLESSQELLGLYCTNYKLSGSNESNKLTFSALFKLENSLVLIIRLKYANKSLEINYINNRLAGTLFLWGSKHHQQNQNLKRGRLVSSCAACSVFEASMESVSGRFVEGLEFWVSCSKFGASFK